MTKSLYSHSRRCVRTKEDVVSQPKKAILLRLTYLGEFDN